VSPALPLSRSEYLERVMEVYQGEVHGEGLFSRMAALATTAERRRKFENLLQLESEAKVRLRPFLARLGLSVVEDESSRASGRELGEQLAAQPWEVLLKTFLADIDRYISRYQALADAAPAADREPLQFMVEHERALSAFLKQELAGQPDQSLRAILPLLAYPLPAADAGAPKS
jgi:hypothetical protein